MGDVIYLAQPLRPRPEASQKRIKRLVKEAAANWTDVAVLQKARAAREAKLAARPLLGVAPPDDFILGISPAERAFVKAVAEDVLRTWDADTKLRWPSKPKPKPKDGAQ